jgi:hypothetical protein
MVKLSDIFIITIGFNTFFFLLSLFFMLLIFRMMCSKMKIFPSFAKLKIRYVILITVAGSILLFFSMAAIFKITSTKEIASVKNDLETCTSLRVYDPWGGSKAFKGTTEDPNVLGQFAASMANVKYERWRSIGRCECLDHIYIILYKNDAQVGDFRISHGNFLDTYDTTLSANTYRCSDNSLAEKTRKILAQAKD